MQDAQSYSRWEMGSSGNSAFFTSGLTRLNPDQNTAAATAAAADADVVVCQVFNEGPTEFLGGWVGGSNIAIVLNALLTWESYKVFSRERSHNTRHEISAQHLFFTIYVDTLIRYCFFFFFIDWPSVIIWRGILLDNQPSPAALVRYTAGNKA